MTAIKRFPIVSSNTFLRKSQSPVTSFFQETDEPDNIDYRFESARLNSFKGWPCPWMKPERLAAAGFYYTGREDNVKCFECTVEISKWETDDDPVVDHQRWSRRCRFVNNLPCGNVPIGVDPSTIPTPSPKGVDVCGPHRFMPFSSPDDDIEDNMMLNLYNFSGTPSKPKHPQFATYESRVRTFELWPKSLKQSKQDLANAGFYYTGTGDQTLCYYCGGGLRDWDPEDVPWEQHAKWFEHCAYLIACKGNDYISKVIDRMYFTMDNQNKPSAEDEESHKSDDKSEKADEDEGIASGSSSQKSEDTDVESISSGSSESMDKKPNPSFNESLGDFARMCKICYIRELRMVFIPCGHLLACAECAQNMKTCGVCRKPVKVTVQAYIP